MPAARVNLSIEQGATFAQPLIWQQADGTPVNLAGFSARMQIRPSVRSADVLLELTSANGGILLDSASGAVTISISAEQTAALPTRGGVYDLELVQGSVVTRFVEGTIFVSPEVTR